MRIRNWLPPSYAVSLLIRLVSFEQGVEAGVGNGMTRGSQLRQSNCTHSQLRIERHVPHLSGVHLIHKARISHVGVHFIHRRVLHICVHLIHRRAPHVWACTSCTGVHLIYGCASLSDWIGRLALQNIGCTTEYGTAGVNRGLIVPIGA
jgi:hypothetical protein